jgi:soluble cytochrome b562
MSLRTLIPFIIIIATSVTSFGQSIEPMDLAQKIFNKEPFPDIEKYIIGDYKGRPNGQDLQSDSITRFILLGQTSTKAVVAMTIIDSTNKGIDSYLHFEKDSIWKMRAFRALAGTGYIEQLKNQLERMTPEQVDELIEMSKKAKRKEHVVFASREDYDFKLGNAKLIIELDENIIQHFMRNKVDFERIKDAALKELEKDKHAVKMVEDIRNEYRKLFVSSVSYGKNELGGKCLNFLIGGMMDNTVGFLYVKDKIDLPKMHESQVIMLREIGDGWYLYKTT